MSQIVWTSRLPAIIGRVTPRASLAVYKTAADVEATAKTLAPVDTGHLRSSIQHHPTGALSAEVTVGAEYGPYVEFGTSRMGAQPFLTPAVQQHGPTMEKALGEIFS